MEQSDTILESLTFSAASIEATVPLDTGAVIKYRIVDIRRERTGLHGAAAMLMGKRILNFSVFNLGRTEDRRTLRRGAIGRTLSFATLALWQRPMIPEPGLEVGGG